MDGSSMGWLRNDADVLQGRVDEEVQRVRQLTIECQKREAALTKMRDMLAAVEHNIGRLYDVAEERVKSLDDQLSACGGECGVQRPTLPQQQQQKQKLLQRQRQRQADPDHNRERSTVPIAHPLAPR